MKSSISEVTSMRKLTTLVGDELSVISNIIVIEIKYIPKTKLRKTLKYP